MMNNQPSSIYGPVDSWRVGKSMGVDVICISSVCSFRCIYCQLGQIVHPTTSRQVFVPTEKVLEDFDQSNWRDADIITYSGSGEPTLATNLGEIARGIRARTETPQLVLTNGAHLHEPEVAEALQHTDRVFVKLDAPDEVLFQRMNRPVEGVTYQQTLDNVRAFRQHYPGMFGLQIMVMALNQGSILNLAETIMDIAPDEVQLNTPTRPVARQWHIASRGGHSPEQRPYETVSLSPVSREDAARIEKQLHQRTGIPIRSVYRPE